MAAETKRPTIPYIPTQNWWDLRKRFVNSPPSKVTPGLVQSILDLSNIESAKNVVRPFRSLGLIDDEGRPTKLFNDWRSDEHYPEVCKTIRESVYPEELLIAYPAPNPDMTGVQNWFMRNLGVGKGAAARQAAFYELLCQADPSAMNRPAPLRDDRTPRQTTPRVKVAARAEIRSQNGKGHVQEEPGQERTLRPPAGLSPQLHINIQIHIAADASATQIDQIFESMARHLRPGYLAEA